MEIFAGGMSIVEGEVIAVVYYYMLPQTDARRKEEYDDSRMITLFKAWNV